MAGTFSINDFKAEFGSRGGSLRPNRFRMTFPTPPVMLGSPHYEANRTIEYWCESVSIPGFQIATNDTRRWTYGPSEKRPFMPNFTQAILTFIADQDASLIRFFTDWMQQIMPHDTRNGLNNTFIRGNRQPYELAYKQNYVTDLNITVFDQAGEEKLVFVLKEAFPSAIPDIPLNWGDNNNLMRFQVIMDYVDWYIQEPQGPLGSQQ